VPSAVFFTECWAAAPSDDHDEAECYDVRSGTYGSGRSGGFEVDNVKQAIRGKWFEFGEASGSNDRCDGDVEAPIAIGAKVCYLRSF
jgi:hypothetical protein